MSSSQVYNSASIFCLLTLVFLGSCSGLTDTSPPGNEPDSTSMADGSKLYLGADLSYANEMDDCGGQFRVDGIAKDVFAIFKDNGANLVRIRLWHNPDWTSYSNLQDVMKSIRRAKEQKMAVLLDFHYSDDWADPAKQIVPAAWKHVTDVGTLGDSVYQYTYRTLEILSKAQLLPEFVQVGNEINSEILVEKPAAERNKPIDWKRNVALLNKGIKAVRDISKAKETEIGIFIHIAQPENAFSWFDNAFANGIASFDWIGLSYYPKWSSYSLGRISGAIDSLKMKYGKKVMIVETGYPHGLAEFDQANNILGSDALITGYPANPEGQRDFMIELTQQVINGGGGGVIYWEPAWISTPCKTRWGTGSHWDNATFFDAKNKNNTLEAFKYYNHKYNLK